MMRSLGMSPLSTPSVYEQFGRLSRPRSLFLYNGFGQSAPHN